MPCVCGSVQSVTNKFAQQRSAETTLPSVSIIVPLLDERLNLPVLVEQLMAIAPSQIILVDGGSTDGSWQWIQQYVNATVESAAVETIALQHAAGRAGQMNAGARHASAELLLFLHADTRLPPNPCRYLAALDQHDLAWGRYDVQFDSEQGAMSVIAWFINWRSRFSGIATGDQAIFVTRAAFDKVGGFDELPLMEDVALCRKLKGVSKPLCLQQRVTTSARRWQQGGIARTVLLMWLLRFAYWVGVSPARLARYYARFR